MLDSLRTSFVNCSEPVPNHPAAGKAGFTPWLPIGHCCSGVPEPGRWTNASDLYTRKRRGKTERNTN